MTVPVKYLRDKAGKIVGEIWQGKKKMDTGTMFALGGVVAVAFLAVGYAWWQMNKPVAGMGTCHTCGSS